MTVQSLNDSLFPETRVSRHVSFFFISRDPKKRGMAARVVAGIGETWTIWQRGALPSELVRFCLCLAAIAAGPTAGLGWLFGAAGNGAGSPQLLMFHRWLGTAAAVWLTITALYCERDARLGQRSRCVRLLLIGGILITALTAHLGGLLAHGEDFFTY